MPYQMVSGLQTTTSNHLIKEAPGITKTEQSRGGYMEKLNND
jgi:hypothetical protein